MSGARILVVEDHPLNMKLVRDVLAVAGYEVVEARTGEEALVAARRQPPDLVLMDLQLPGIDGTETLRRLRAAGGLGAVPVVAVSASAMQGDRSRVQEAGFDGFIGKPLSIRALPGQLAGFLGGRASGG
ncbi:two-component system, cell cycle response regulator DivK [Friedmanniella luteola]|uniref:Two-component system, cell cycle response regulator DivK n=1 Tax=Friedmanniella luteola TaxID=546871 RepID=A0A1H1XKJ6_9ACTN|nr:response regulator [Friedmanniella luteola]SDT09216.1 two-component system, cell cycle response regulator DivK [Friedmanniella luteola]